MISVAMISMNEENAVRKVIEDIKTAVAGLDAEILVVDSSKDRTPEIAAAAGARVVRQFPPQGYGRAMGRALSEGLGDVVITLDCDDTYPAEDVPRLANLRRRGLLEYGVLGQIHSMDFHKKWVIDPKRNADEFLTAPEISTLTDYGTSYDNIEKMQPFPVDKGSFLALAAAVALPMIPVVLTEIPLVEILKALLEAAK